MGIRYAICNELYQGWEIGRVFAHARSLGYHGVEIAPFTLAEDCREIFPGRRSAIRRVAEAEGVEIVGLHWLLSGREGLNICTPDALVRRATAEYIEALAGLCSDLGGRIMVFGSPKHRRLAPSQAYLEAWRLAVDLFRGMAEKALRAGVTIAFEPLGPEETDFVNTMAEGSLLVREVGSPAFKLHLDVKAMATEGRPPHETIKLEGGRNLVHFHANDPNRKGPGMGALDFTPIAAALKETGYGGYVSVEIFDFSEGPEVTAAASISTLKKCFERG
ncbi:MAG: sugar phosphate isomerase/epimerase [Planctomycetota bacterium]|nr:sugar phosphate isomerase/epimerase [Planctomycetota bacterium]